MICISSASADQKEDWKVLNANSQNLARKLLSKKGHQDINIFEPELSKIIRSLDALTSSGELVAKVVEFKYGGDLDELLAELSQIEGLNAIVAEYGVYTASEMLDISKFSRGFKFKDDDGMVKLEVKLPASKIETFLQSIKDINHKGTDKIPTDIDPLDDGK